MGECVAVSAAGHEPFLAPLDLTDQTALLNFADAMHTYSLRAVHFHPRGGQSDFAWLSARTPHGAYVW